MKRMIKNIIYDIIFFLPCLTGLFLIDDEAKTIYLITCLITFLQMEVFFAFLQMKHCLRRDIGAVLWLVFCYFICPKTPPLTGNRGFLWLVLAIYILAQSLRDMNHKPKLRRLGNTVLYLTNLSICLCRYFVSIIMLILYTTVNESVWYINTPNYEVWVVTHILFVFVLLLIMMLFKIIPYNGMRKIKANGITDCVMHASVYDCIELYSLPRIVMLHMELSILTGHGMEKSWTDDNKIQNTYIGRYSVNLWEYAKDLPNKTCVLYWNSKKDSAWSKNKMHQLKAYIAELEQYGCNIVIVDMYDGRKAYGDADSIGAYLRKNFPYYYRNEMENIILFVKRERETYRNLLIQIMDEAEKLEIEKKKMLESLLQQLTGNVTSRIRCFYVLMKICEYIIHTEALSILASAKNISKDMPENTAKSMLPNVPINRSLNMHPNMAASMVKPSMGTFVQLLDRSEIITKKDYANVIQSVRYIESAMIRNGKSQVKSSEVSYHIICEKIVNLRNRMIGHGTMVYAVSEELVEHLARVTLFMLQRYSQKPFNLCESMTINIQNEDILCVCMNQDRICLYNGIEADGNILYLDYVTGNTIRSQGGKLVKKSLVEVEAFQKYMEETI